MDKSALLLAELNIAVQAALDGDWEKSHNIAQDYSDPTANWILAVLHKIEGDVWNSQYWYARTSGLSSGGKKYEDFTEARDELLAILQYLNT